jgi:hypothetical protein
MTTVEALREARALYAAAPSHVPHPQCPGDGRHCPMTAIHDATRRRLDPLGRDAVHPDVYLRRAMGHTDSIVDWNAKHSTEEVLAAFDRAIELAEQQS